MPLPKTVLSKYKNDVFVETGTLNGEAVRLALDCEFKAVHSIDIDKIRIETLRPAMRGAPVTLYAGSSADVLGTILKRINGRITFWLDAHPPGNVLDLVNTPVAAELEAIRNYVHTLPTTMLPTVMLDDMRLFTVGAKEVIVETLKASWRGELLYEDTNIATNDIMVYKPVQS